MKFNKFNIIITVVKFLKGAAGVAIAFIIYNIFSSVSATPVTFEQVNQSLVQINKLIDKLFLLTGVLAGLFHALSNVLSHWPKKSI